LNERVSIDFRHMPFTESVTDCPDLFSDKVHSYRLGAHECNQGLKRIKTQYSYSHIGFCQLRNNRIYSSEFFRKTQSFIDIE